jgi:hypothetical protein
VDAGAQATVRRPFVLFPPGDTGDTVLTVAIHVGEEADVDAGNAWNLLCDDITFFEWATEGQTHLVFKAVKPGSTLCRIGVPRPGFPNRLIQLTVEPAVAPTDAGTSDAGLPTRSADSGQR